MQNEDDVNNGPAGKSTGNGKDGVASDKSEDELGTAQAQEKPDAPLWRMQPDGHLQSAVGESLSGAITVAPYELPSRRLTLLVEGRDYLKYRDTFERLLFAEKMTVSQKDAKILQMAMTCLVERMEAVTVETGEPFVRAEMLAG